MSSPEPIPPTRMRLEIDEIPAAVDRLLTEGGARIGDAAAALRERDPPVVISVARGSSDHAAGYFKYLAELVLGVPVASVGPSVASIYGARLRLDRGACLAISQSGASPDITQMARMARASGALSLALTNDAASPLARACDRVLELHAGPEQSVAATKTFVTSTVAAALLVAEWAEDAGLRDAIHGLPEVLARAVAEDWPELRAACAEGASMFCLGRGPGFAVAGEAALKVKETCRFHAEAYSSAEVMHGPVAIVEAGFPVVALAAADAAETALAEVADDLAQKGASAFVTSDGARHARQLPAIRTGHPLLDPIALVATFYATVERVAVARGIDPDAPRHLAKITETV